MLASSRVFSSRIPFGAQWIGLCRMMCSAVCSSPHLHAAEKANPHLRILAVGTKASNPFLRQLSLTHADLGRVIPFGLMSDRNVWSLVVFACHLLFHIWSVQCAALMSRSPLLLSRSCAAGTNDFLDFRRCHPPTGFLSWS